MFSGVRRLTYDQGTFANSSSKGELYCTKGVNYVLTERSTTWHVLFPSALFWKSETCPSSGRLLRAGAREVFLFPFPTTSKKICWWTFFCSYSLILWDVLRCRRRLSSSSCGEEIGGAERLSLRFLFGSLVCWRTESQGTRQAPHSG